MNTYTTGTLADGESARYLSGLHWAIFVRPIVGFYVGLALAGYAWNSMGIRYDAGGRAYAMAAVGIVLVGLSLLSFVSRMLRMLTTEYTITSDRVICKSGFIARRTDEVLLSHIGSFSVDQSALGRMLGYGDLVVGGRAVFTFISDPVEFRRQIQRRL